MENLDIIIFTAILILLFIVFGIGTLLEFKRMSEEKFDVEKNRGGVETLKKFIGKILDGSPR